MVHYDPANKNTGPNPPATCPKCGSHRTQIVGMSDEGRTIVVRCNACGARSEVTVLPDERALEPAGAAAVLRVQAWQHT
jgi:hypothetical protein